MKYSELKTKIALMSPIELEQTAMVCSENGTLYPIIGLVDCREDGQLVITTVFSDETKMQGHWVKRTKTNG